ncbi:MAG: tetratricopeptide repeat protein [Gemmataceae bacterium]|nr:tetratricopeptide repeat protein [Gemmataceae bacterium]
MALTALLLFASAILATPTQLPAGQTPHELLEAAAGALKIGKPKEALRLAEKAIALAPTSARGYVVRGIAHDALEEYTRAVEDFTKAIELDPKAAEAYDRRGSAHFKRGQFAESVRDFDRYLDLVPRQQEGHWRRGISCYYARQYDAGRRQFEAYEAVDTNDVENAVWRYLCMAPKVGVEKARAAMLKVGQDRRVPMMEVYDLFCGKIEPAVVLAAVERGKPPAADRNRRLFYAHLYLGLYHESLGNGKRALEHLTTAAEHRIGHYMWDVARVHRDYLRRQEKK